MAWCWPTARSPPPISPPAGWCGCSRWRCPTSSPTTSSPRRGRLTAPKCGHSGNGCAKKPIGGPRRRRHRPSEPRRQSTGSGSAHRRVKGAAVEQQVLTDNKAGGCGAQKGTGVAELRRVADAPGRVCLAALGEQFFERDVLPPCLVLDARTQPVGQKRAGQQSVDCHIVFRHLAGDAGAEGGQ